MRAFFRVSSEGTARADDVLALFLRPFPILLREQERRQLLFHLPFHVVRQQAQEDMAFDPVSVSR